MSLEKKPVQKGTKPERTRRMHQCIKMERAQVNVWYSFTFSPTDLRSSVGGAKEMTKSEVRTFDTLNEHYQEWLKVLKKLKFCELEIVPELSSLGRLHYHARLKILNKLGFYYRDLFILASTGSFEVDTISDEKIWETYKAKQREDFKYMIEHYNWQLPMIVKNDITASLEK